MAELALHPLSASPAWAAIDFISDLHLAEDTPHTFAAWAHYLEHTQADAVFILGDLFEAWVGDDARSQGFESRCAAVLSAATRQRFIGFMAGNRDFLLGDEMLQACGIHHLLDATVLQAFGQRALLTHGDAWCTGDTDYQRFRAQVRSPEWRASVLAQPLDQRRALAREIRSASEMRSTQHQGPWFDVDAPTALQAMRQAQAPTLIHGHTHRPADEPLAPGFMRHVLSDWDLDHDPANPRAQGLRWSARGFERLEVKAAC